MLSTDTLEIFINLLPISLIIIYLLVRLLKKKENKIFRLNKTSICIIIAIFIVQFFCQLFKIRAVNIQINNLMSTIVICTIIYISISLTFSRYKAIRILNYVLLSIFFSLYIYCGTIITAAKFLGKSIGMKESSNKIQIIETKIDSRLIYNLERERRGSFSCDYVQYWVTKKDKRFPYVEQVLFDTTFDCTTIEDSASLNIQQDLRQIKIFIKDYADSTSIIKVDL